MRALIVTVLLLAICLTSCNTPESIAKFASSAVAALQPGEAMLDDIEPSCARATAYGKDIEDFVIPESNSACKSAGEKAASLKTASKVLVAYFAAINGLASFGTSKAGEDAQKLTVDLSKQANAGEPASKAAGAIASFLTKSLTGVYRGKKLAEAFQVHDDVNAVLKGLGEAIGGVYVNYLTAERDRLGTRYKLFVKAHPATPDAILTLDGRWQSDMAAFAAKERAARAYQSAMGALAKANDELEKKAGTVDLKELPALLSPYAAQLDSLIPTIQKAFF